MLCTGGGPLPGSGLRAASLWARPLPKKRRKMVFGWGWHLLFCARAKRDERKVVSDAVWHGAGIKDKKGPPPPQRPKTKQKAWEKSVEKKRKQRKGKKGGEKKKKNHGTQDSRVVPHRGTNWAALWLTAQIGRDAVLSESYGRGYRPWHCGAPSGPTWSLPLTSGPV